MVYSLAVFVRHFLLFLCIVSCKPDNAQQQQKPLLRVAFLLRIALVIPAGFEPTTHSLEGCCSIQLSYGTISDYLQRLSPIHHKAPKGAPSWPLKWLFGSFCAAKVIKIYQFAKSLLLTPQFCRSAPSPTHSHNPGSWRSAAACLAAHSRWPPS